MAWTLNEVKTKIIIITFKERRWDSVSYLQRLAPRSGSELCLGCLRPCRAEETVSWSPPPRRSCGTLCCPVPALGEGSLAPLSPTQRGQGGRSLHSRPLLHGCWNRPGTLQWRRAEHWIEALVSPYKPFWRDAALVDELSSALSFRVFLSKFSLCLSVSVCLSVYLSLSLAAWVCLCLSVCLSVSFCLCLSFSVSVSLC